MEKLKMLTRSKNKENFVKLEQLFPNAITEVKNEHGEVVRAIDKDILMQEISSFVVEGGEERYQFTWPDKQKSIFLANAAIAKTLRPCRRESISFNDTKNLYIEGDNLEVLKLLQETYLGKIKMIYIDPPYNTRKDFIYNDDFANCKGDYLPQSGQFDDAGNRLFQNTESNGRFHTDWLNMIYPRIKLSRDLLREDGLLFVSIDDNEVSNLIKICDELYGSENAVGPLVWSLPRGINAGLVARAHEYVLVYSKNSDEINNFHRLDTNDEYSDERCNKRIDDRHPESIIDFPAGIRYEGENKVFSGEIGGNEKITIIGELEFRDGVLAKPASLSAGWTMKRMIQSWLKGETVYDTKGQKIIEFFFKSNGKLYSRKEISTCSIKSILKNIPDTQVARTEVENLLGNDDIFPYPKPIDLTKMFLKLCVSKEDIILDFFSGSATTAHAVMQLNAEDGGNRKFIMVQIPEETDEKSEAFKAGYKNICEIGKERIRRAGTKIKDENPLTAQNLDIGFRVLKCDTSNMKDVYYNPSEYEPDLLGTLADNIKEDRTPEDLLFQVMIDLGVLLSSKIEESTIAGKKVFNVAEGFLITCFDEDVTEDTITEIAKKKPYYFVMRDKSLAEDSVATNFEQIFATFSPDTVRKVL